MSENKIALPTICRLCGEEFYGPNGALGEALLLNEKPARKALRFMEQLTIHLAKKHEGYIQQAMTQQAEYYGLLVLSAFDTRDEAIATSRDQMRWRINHATRRAVITDDRILERVNILFTELAATLAPDYTVTEHEAMRALAVPPIASLIREMRDVLMETGRYAEPSPIADPKNGTPAAATPNQ